MNNKEIPYKIYLEENEMPRQWYNVRADMKKKPAPLLNAETSFGESLCVSNELVEDEGRITIGEGMAWMILSRD